MRYLSVKILCDSYSTALLVADRVARLIRGSRFCCSDIDIVRGHRRHTVQVHEIRLRVAKPYCGNHAGPCKVPGRHRKAAYLEGADWVAFNDWLNDLLDGIDHDGRVFSSVCDVRIGRRRRICYTSTGAIWDRIGEESDYRDCCGSRAPRAICTPGTPGER